MFKLRWYLLVGIVTYVLCLAVMLPIRFVLEQLPQAARLGPVMISNPSGTVWRGRADLNVRAPGYSDQLDANWRLHPLQLLTGKLGARLDVVGNGFRLDGDVAASPGTVHLKQVQGRLASDLVNRITRQQGAEVSGHVELNGVSLVYDFREKNAQTAQGELIWTGGDVTYRQGRNRFNFTLNPIRGELQANEGNLAMAVKDAQKNQGLAHVELQNNGWAQVEIYKRSMEWAGQASNVSNPDKSMFQIKHKLF